MNEYKEYEEEKLLAEKEYQRLSGESLKDAQLVEWKAQIEELGKQIADLRSKVNYRLNFLDDQAHFKAFQKVRELGAKLVEA